MKIVHVVRQYAPSVGGLEDVVQNLAKWQFETLHHRPMVITLDRVFTHSKNKLPSDVVIEGIRVQRLPYLGSNRYPIATSVLQAVNAADIVHVHGIDFFFDFLALTKIIHGKPMVVSTHGGFFHTPFAARLKKLYFHTITSLSSKAYGRVIASSANDYDIFSSIVPPSKLVTIELGVDTSKFRDCSSKILKKSIIYFGRWSTNKGLQDAIRIFALLHRVDPEWKLTIAGREYDLTLPILQDLLKTSGIHDAVTVVPNPTKELLVTLIGESSYFICLSKHEGFGLAAIEAVSAGLTPILSNIPPFEKLIKKVPAGILIDSNGDTSNVNRIVALANSQVGDYSLIRAELQNSVTSYAWRNVVSKYESEYEAVLPKF